ncbi:hypothetical protein [Thermoleptolyngbya sp.]
MLLTIREQESHPLIKAPRGLPSDLSAQANSSDSVTLMRLLAALVSKQS